MVFRKTYDMYTTEQAAAILGISARRVRALVKEGRLSAQKAGRDWLIDEHEVEQRNRTGAKPGRPRQDSQADIFSCTLMNLAHEVAAIRIDRRSTTVLSIEPIEPDYAPPGACSQASRLSRASVSGWLANRKLSSVRPDLKVLLGDHGYENESRYLLDNLALSLSDGCWLRPEGSALSWCDVSLFSNRYIDAADPAPVARIGRSPSTNGAQRKWWEQGSDLSSTLVKAGKLDSLAERAATMMFERILEPTDYVAYELVERDGELCSACPDFIAEGQEFVTMEEAVSCYRSFSDVGSYDAYAEVCERLGVADARAALSRMIVCDYIMANRDRHPGNLGLIRNSEALTYAGPAPLFDSGQAFFRGAVERGRFDGSYFYRANPFTEHPERQLALAENWDWIEFEKLKGFPGEVAALYLENDAADKAVADTMRELLEKRIARVEEMALQAEFIQSLK